MKKKIYNALGIMITFFLSLNLLSLKSDWAVAGFVLITISLIYLTYKNYKKL
jgi:hypothetical protein